MGLNLSTNLPMFVYTFQAMFVYTFQVCLHFSGHCAQFCYISSHFRGTLEQISAFKQTGGRLASSLYQEVISTASSGSAYVTKGI